MQPELDLLSFAVFGFLDGSGLAGQESSFCEPTSSTSSSRSSASESAPGFTAREEAPDFLSLRLVGVSPGIAREAMARLKIVGHWGLAERETGSRRGGRGPRAARRRPACPPAAAGPGTWRPHPHQLSIGPHRAGSGRITRAGPGARAVRGLGRARAGVREPAAVGPACSAAADTASSSSSLPLTRTRYTSAQGPPARLWPPTGPRPHHGLTLPTSPAPSLHPPPASSNPASAGPQAQCADLRAPPEGSCLRLRLPA